MGAELHHKDSESQQKEEELQSIQRELEKMHDAEMVEATLGSERTAFGVAKESLESDLDQALTAKDATKAHIQQIIDQCQREIKVFKFKKYKDRYEDGKRGSIPRYPLEIDAFFESQGLGR